ncbi:MAG: hypothetical protein RR555_11210 [Bacteroidales bacterium]
MSDILQNPKMKKNPFTVPDGYFSALEDQMRVKICGAEKEEHSSYTILRTTVTMAAMFALIFGLGYSALYITKTLDTKTLQEKSLSENTPVPESVSDEELNQYLGRYPAYTPSDEEITKIEVVTPTVNKDEIEQYLIDSNTSVATVLAALE